jgi:RNA polymerase sigma factor (TIGR02999 family)
MDSAPITELLRRSSRGDREAERRLITLLYPTLRRIARGPGAWADRSTSPTGVLHEVYLRLFSSTGTEWASRRGFFHAFARCARDRRVDRARRRAHRRATALTTSIPSRPCGSPSTDDRLELEERLAQLERVDRRAARALRLHCLHGKTVPEMVALLGQGHTAIEKHLRFARAWLRQRMATDPTHEPGLP